MATGWLWEERYAWFDAMTWNDFDSTPAKSYVQPQEAFEVFDDCVRLISGLQRRLFPTNAE